MFIRYRKKSDKIKKRELAEIKKKILELKKDMIFTNSLKNKITKNIINTPRTHRSDDLLLPISTIKENNLQLTNRTNKSVHFDDTLINNKIDNDETKNSLTLTNPLTERYIRLLNTIDIPVPLSARSDTSIHSKYLNLSLPLTLDPISTLDTHRSMDNLNITENQTARSVQSSDTSKNEDFLTEYVISGFTSLI